MAWSYLELYNNSNSSELNNRVQMACLKIAVDVQNEDPGTSNHASRLVLANRVVNGSGLPSRVVALLALRNPALQVASPTDSDIDFTVSQQWDFLSSLG